MSYCRISIDSDVYMFPHVYGYITCMGCSLNSEEVPYDDPHFFDPRDALEHLRKHIEAGHKVPQYAIDRLIGEMNENTKKI